MFGDLMGMMGKLKETQQKIEETKERLNTIYIDEQSRDEALKVTVTANGYLKSVTVLETITSDPEQLEDYLVLVINNALKKAKQIQEAELAAVAKEGMPSIPGLDLFK
ncbi:YbaB/EbfC family nucleoid-associated protein [Flavobacterium sp.]|uniref:YbaB/EbfC family nucleoid-associated protein n=1 Tax=Flavobacterium sp. TaxID=239 RepID=UPI002FDB1496